ncbi:MAG: efflux RND transporter periplasmic adaptor subunit [Cyclobacteriaceae bacterium]
MKYFYLLLVITLIGCQLTEEHGHEHDADGGHIGEETGVPGRSETIWTDKTELFVEFPALVVGQTSRFAAHFTMLERHKPITDGTVTVSLVKGTKGIRHKVDAPNSPGIFTPALQPKEAGSYQLIFDLETPAYSDQIVLTNVTVYGSLAEAVSNSTPEEEVDAISFLKEQAWKIAFQTKPVVEGEVYDVIHTSGIWEEAPNTYKSLVATTSGVVTYTDLNLTEGAEVRKGQLLATISSEGLTANNLATEVANAKSIYEQVKSEYDRKLKLYESRIVSRADFEEVEGRYKVAKSNFDALNNGFSQYGKQVYAPYDGFVKSFQTSNGSYVKEGTSLVTVGTHKSKLLIVQVSPSHNHRLESIHNIWYQSSMDNWSDMLASGSSILSIGKEVEDDHPMLPIYVQVNEEVEQPDGGYAEVQVGVGGAGKALVVPTEALLEDYGTYSVIVQLGGESFERREVALGRRNGRWVEVLDGLTANEWVVTEGAFQVKMTSMSGQTPSHGHAH